MLSDIPRSISCYVYVDDIIARGKFEEILYDIVKVGGGIMRKDGVKEWDLRLTLIKPPSFPLPRKENSFLTVIMIGSIATQK